MAPNWILLLATTTLVVASPTHHESINQSEEQNSTLDFATLSKCSSEGGVTGLVNCAASRTLKMINQVSMEESLEILPGIALISGSPGQRQGKSVTEEQLPQDPQQKTEKLLSLMVDAATRLLSGKTLKIQIPEFTVTSIARAFEEGRAKMKKGMMSPLMLILGVKAILFKALLLGGLGLMSLKALLFSKMALVLAVIMGAQSLFGQGFNFKGGSGSGGMPLFGGHGWISGWSGGNSGGYGPPYGTTNQIGGGWSNSQYPYARSINNVKDNEEPQTSAQDLAYSAQKS